MVQTKYQPGDLVRVLDLKDITHQFRRGSRNMPSGCFFAPSMEMYCGHQFEIEKVVTVSAGVGYYTLSGDSTIRGWHFTDEMLEPVYDPQEDLKEMEIKFSFEDLMVY